jgi:hypothetical protein
VVVTQSVMCWDGACDGANHDKPVIGGSHDQAGNFHQKPS